MLRSTQISETSLIPCVMAKDDPTWRFALGANPTTEGWIFAIHGDNGKIGYG